jgi:DNA adenine methylase
MPSYPGGKNGAGVWQRIINQIPPHDVWISAFCGECAVTRHIRPATQSYLIDLDSAVLRRWIPRQRPNTALIEADASAWLRFAAGLDLAGTPNHAPAPAATFRVLDRWTYLARVFVYVDPPYLPETCISRPRYQHVLSTEQHAELLKLLQMLPWPVLLHGYPSPLYEAALESWRTFTFRAMSRGGLRTEQVWCNYPEPQELHDYRWLGGSKREREKLARRLRNLIRWLRGLPTKERDQLLAAVDAEFRDRVPPAGPPSQAAGNAAQRARERDAEQGANHA